MYFEEQAQKSNTAMLQNENMIQDDSNNLNEQLGSDSRSQCQVNVESQFGLEGMFHNYKRIGGELKNNIQHIDSQRIILQKDLNCLTKKCEILEQKKELQKNNLMELQIKSENLSSALFNKEHDFQKTLTENLKLTTEKFQSVSQNADYIRSKFAIYNNRIHVQEEEGQKLTLVTKELLETSWDISTNYKKEITNDIRKWTVSVEEIRRDTLEFLIKEGILKFKELKIKFVEEEKYLKEMKGAIESLKNKIPAIEKNLELAQSKNSYLESKLKTSNDNLNNFLLESNIAIQERKLKLDCTLKEKVQIKEVNSSLFDTLTNSNIKIKEYELILPDKLSKENEMMKSLQEKKDATLDKLLEKDQILQNTEELREKETELYKLQKEEEEVIEIKKQIKEKLARSKLTLEESIQNYFKLVDELKVGKQRIQEDEKKIQQMETKNNNLEEELKDHTNQYNIMRSKMENASLTMESLALAEDEWKSLSKEYDITIKEKDKFDSELESLEEEIKKREHDALLIMKIRENLEENEKKLCFDQEEEFRNFKIFLNDLEGDLFEINAGKDSLIPKQLDDMIHEFVKKQDELDKLVELELKTMSEEHLTQIKLIKKKMEETELSIKERIQNREDKVKDFMHPLKSLKEGIESKKNSMKSSMEPIISRVINVLHHIGNLIQSYKWVSDMKGTKEFEVPSKIFGAKLEEKLVEIMQNMGNKKFLKKQVTSEELFEIFQQFTAEFNDLLFDLEISPSLETSRKLLDRTDSIFEQEKASKNLKSQKLNDTNCSSSFSPRSQPRSNN